MVLTALLLLESTFFSPFMQSFASGLGATKVIIHYQPAVNDTKEWGLWVFPEGGEGKAYTFTDEDAFGKVAEIELPGNYDKVGFIVRTESWEKDGGDRFIQIVNGEGEVWVKGGDKQTYTSPPDGEYRDVPKYGKVNVTINYHRYNGDYQGWNIWTWPEKGSKGKQVKFTETTAFGKRATYTISNENGDLFEKIGFIVRKSTAKNEWAERDGGDRFITNIKKDGGVEIWIVQGKPQVYDEEGDADTTRKITKASMDTFQQITLETNVPFNCEKDFRHIKIDGVQIAKVIPYQRNESAVTNKVKVITKQPLDVAKTYKVKKTGYGSAIVAHGQIVRTKKFDQKFYYKGHDLGNTYTKAKTKFRVWAPTASEAKLVLYRSWNGPAMKEIPMKKSKRGTWKTVLKGNHDEQIYTYKVKIGDQWNEAVDPYVRATTVNGQRGVVVDLAKTNPQRWTKQRPKLKNPEDSIIYELHVRDLSSQKESGIKHQGKFLGVTEWNTKGPKGVKTGLSHIKDLGVTHVQFLPIYDYRTVDETKLNEPQFNWGYDPQNYNVPEGSYSTNPYEPKTRIKELKQMVQTLHDHQLRIVMDVVYNHVYAVSEHSFDQLVPGYFFRYKEDGSLSNGTGVGNDTASERNMVRKFIVDSVTYWAKEYHIDGFRFDLMGIHDTKTMNQVRKKLTHIDRSILTLGEGWDLATELTPEQKANQKNAQHMKRIAHFNDRIRDGLKGSVFFDDDNGFVNGKQGQEKLIQQSIAAGIDYDRSIATYEDPDQVVTYVEAHDNHTLWDKLQLTNPNDSEQTRKQMHKLASSIVLTSQGIQFIHAGQEFMRTKGGDHNSYRSPDSVNQLDWKRRATFSREVDYMKGLIALRKKYSSFRMTNAKAIQRNLQFLDAPANVVAYTLHAKANRDKANEIAVIHNANKQSKVIPLPVDGAWKLLVDGQHAGTKTIGVIKGSHITVAPLSTFVLVR
ncbi:type I pullulanase [Bacillus sp. WMMC1349]|uniref:type I pullulanase n=1 Tax=Bacillus sp. WMMC1349 TaxID=2736254 RepID=UPI0015557033|nr:type I pullulanase [Bacillus sp. WMMC1349]